MDPLDKRRIHISEKNMYFDIIINKLHVLAVTCDFQQCGILTSVDSDEHVQPPLKFRKLK